VSAVGTKRLVIPPARLAEAYAAILSRDGKATVYGPENSQRHGTFDVLEAVQLAEATPGWACFVRVRSDILALDCDDVTQVAAARELTCEMRREGLAPVVVHSGGEGEHLHVFVRVVSASVRAQLAERADTPKIDVRDAIRPPFVPHRLGGRSRVLEPADPLEALCALAPRVAPPAPLRGLARGLLCRGDPGGRLFPRRDGKSGPDRSRLEASVVMRLARLGYSAASIRSMLLDERNAAGAKLRELRRRSERGASRYFDSLYRTARIKIAAAPVGGGRPEVDATCERAVRMLDAQPALWCGRRGGALYGAGRIVVEFARRAGKLTFHLSGRDLAEALGVDQVTASRYLAALVEYGLIACLKRGGGRWASSWHLVAADTQTGELPGTQSSHSFALRAGGVGGVSRSGASNGIGGVSPSASDRAQGGRTAGPRRGVCALTDYAFPDVFGSRGWFATRGLGHQAAHALILVEDAGNVPVAEEFLVARLGSRASRVLLKLLTHRLLTRAEGGYVRGPATLAQVGHVLKTLGTRSLKRVLHRAERDTYRVRLAGRQAGAEDGRYARGSPRRQQDPWPAGQGVR
jgi:hypothetical protein